MDVRRTAPDFPADLEWVNTGNPPRIAELRGRVIVLWFWTYDSVNCWNLVPDLRLLAERYHDGVTVIGVHCPKYPRQRAGESVLAAVNRLGLRHAVAHDCGFRLWRDYAIEAWPSVAVVDAEGRLAAVFAGEGRRDEIDACIAALLDEAALHDLRVFESTPPALRPEPRLALAFPGKVLADEKFLYVADSGHHRVLECRHDGRVMRVFGSGNAGYGDGASAMACFEDPQGLARHGNALYVADRGSHAVRRIDLESGMVSTVLGTGRPGRSRPDGVDALTCALNSPLDLAVIGDDVYVAVAGQNQIWRLDLATGLVSMLVGNGDLGLADGTGDAAKLAQPCGLAVAGRDLVVADSEASAVRIVHVDDGRIETLLGLGLYEFGDATGNREQARLQHPLAVAADKRGTIYIADSYNDSIKLLRRKTGEVRRMRMQYRLQEVQGLCLAGNLLWIANTNLHEIACVNLTSGDVRRIPVGED